MSLHFHPLTVKEVRKETADCVSVLLTVPDNLTNDFLFAPGQNISIKKNIDGAEVRRSYSICSAPFENELRIAVKKVEGGIFSTFANTQLKAGDVLDIMPPAGKFNTPLQPANKKNYIAIAAGSGITPVISLIKATLKEEPLSSFTLIFGNKNRQSIIFFEELEAIKNKYLNRFVFINILSREKTDTAINFGRIDEKKLLELSRLVDYITADEFFICGPEEMIFCAKDFLEKSGIDKKKIHFELFTSTGGKKQDAGTKKQEDTGAVSKVLLKVDGRSFDFELPLSSDETILDAALKQGADLPFACKGGMCCTCKAKLLEGEVSMDVHWGLEEEEIEKGYILTCQSHPKTENIIIDFDCK
jgi:ring-1,2-phenylacetyl-CoA epoxidase subunit PaaE